MHRNVIGISFVWVIIKEIGLKNVLNPCKNELFEEFAGIVRPLTHFARGEGRIFTSPNMAS